MRPPVYKNCKTPVPERLRINGFTLVEVAAVTAVLGIIIAGILAIIQPMSRAAALKTTKANMSRAVDALAGYVHQYNRLPCPADPDRQNAVEPYGAERGSGASGNSFGNCSGTDVEGVLPFRTLGLTEGEAKDGWGRFFTYRVSPAFAQNPNAGNVHARCRRESVWFDTGGALVIGGGGGDVIFSNTGNINITSGGGPGVGLRNRNAQKARFCCPGTAPFGPATDIVILDGAGGTPIWPFTRSSSDYDDVNEVIEDPAFNPASDNVTVPAMVLVSHGRNGLGAFTEAGARIPLAGASPHEIENANGDRNFVSRIYSEGGGDEYFDDLVVWRTQDHLYTEAGGGSCGLP